MKRAGTTQNCRNGCRNGSCHIWPRPAPTVQGAVQHLLIVRSRQIKKLIALVLVVASSFAAANIAVGPAAAQDVDTEVPPGNPVIGDTRPGDIQQDRTGTLLWGAVAVCLIGAGALLIKVERWEARRVQAAEFNAASPQRQ